MADTQSELYDIALLIDDLRNDDSASRLESMKSLTKIAAALGPERTREELIPFLSESVDDEDEVILTLAEQLGKFIQYIGGPQYIPSLLSLLESLSTVYEPTVRDKAIQSICIMATEMTIEHLNSEFVPMLRNLSSRDWYTSRMSACALFAVAYPRVSDATKAELRGMFGQLCRDDTPMVRRGAALNLGDFAKVVHAEQVKFELLPLFKLLAEDEQDSVRLLAVKNIVAFGEVVQDDEDKDVVLKMTLELANDKSWRVRWSVADSFRSIMNSVGPRYMEMLIPAYVALLKDGEAEVRTAAASKITEVAEAMQSKALVIEALTPLVAELCQDPAENVRASLAMVVMDLAPLLGQEDTITHLLPHFLSLLNDDVPQVRLNIISKFDSLNKVLKIASLKERLLPAIEELASDPKWRIRLKVIEHIPLLASLLGFEVFQESLTGLCMKWLGDEVFSIRQAATKNLETLAKSFGEEWAKGTIIPKVAELNTSTKYLFRMQALRAVEVLITCSTVNKDELKQALLPLVVQMAKDPVPNIRFNVAKCFENMRASLDMSTMSEVVKPCLMELEKDEDGDVKYYALKARAAIGV